MTIQKLICPKCGSGVERFLYLEGAILSRIVLRQDGDTVYINNNYEVIDASDGNENPRFICTGPSEKWQVGCGMVIAAPADLKLEFTE